ncbi:MAG: carbohydrate-binding module family 20 domain-containing protein, partial [Chitinophagaceae bacterium]
MATTSNNTANIAAETSALPIEKKPSVKAPKKTATSTKKKAESPEIKIEKKKQPAKEVAPAKLLKQEDKKAPTKKAKKVAEVKEAVTASEKPKVVRKKSKTVLSTITVTFQLRFHTNYGQSLFITGNHPNLGDNDQQKAVPLEYVNHNLWSVSLPFSSEH